MICLYSNGGGGAAPPPMAVSGAVVAAAPRARMRAGVIAGVHAHAPFITLNFVLLIHLF